MLLANISGQIGPGDRSPCRLVAPPLADALADLLGIEAHQLHHSFIAEQQRGSAFMLSMPNNVFNPYSKTYCTKGSISRWRAAPWTCSTEA
jgi:hypothetical protein